MPVFTIIRQPNANGEKLGPTIAQTYPLHHYVLSDDAWLVAARGTAKDISDRLGVTEGTNGSALVVEAASYFGRANPAIWTWINANWNAGSG